MIHFVDSRYTGNSPAIVNRKTGDVFINEDIYDTLPFEHKLFVRLHEQGHHINNTKNEYEADNYAFKHYVKNGFPLSKSVTAISEVLSFTKPGHFKRLLNIFRNALEYDYINNKNQNALTELKKLYAMYPEEMLKNDSLSFLGGIDESVYEEFKGRGRERREEKHELKREKKESKIEKRRAKTEIKEAKAEKRRAEGEAKIIKAEAKGTAAEAKAILAEQGKEAPSGAEKIIGKAGEAVGGVLGGGVAGVAPEKIAGEGEGGAMVAPKKKILGLPPVAAIIIGIILLLVIIAILYFTVFKKKPA